MKRFFLSIISLFLVCLTAQFTYSAQKITPLSVTSVKVTDNKHIKIVFSEPIDSDSIVLKVTKQSDNSSVKLDSISAIPEEKQSVNVVLDDTLVEASSYTLTVIAGIAISGATITDGASAMQDFITPSPLKIAGEESFNAPSNPNAVMNETSTGKTTTATSPTKTNVATQTKETDPNETSIKGDTTNPTPTDELPLTGPNSLVFLIVSIVIAYFFLKRKALNN